MDDISQVEPAEEVSTEEAAEKVTEIEQAVETFFQKPLPTFRKAVQDSKLALLPVEPDADKK